MNAVHAFWSVSLQRRLLAGGVSLFVITLLAASALQYSQFREFLDSRAQARAVALAENLAVSSRAWVLAHDLAGLQEMARAMQQFPDMRYAMLLDPEGRILAHSDASRDGLYLADATSLALLRGDQRAQRVAAGPGIMDAAAPIITEGRLVGWARVGIGLDYIKLFQRHMAWEVGALLLASSLLGGVALWWLTGGLMRGIDRLMEGARQLEAGQRGARVEIRGHDELARLGLAFNDLAIALETREQALKESEARWLFALEGSDLGVWDWNAVSNKVFFSPRWKSMLGYREDEISDDLSEWDSRVHPDDKTACYAALERHIRGETPTYLSQHRLRAKDGSWRWILDRGKVVEWAADGKPLRIIGTHFDITEQLASDAERAHLQQQLQHVQKLEAIGQLTGGIAHDFNNILGAILGYTNLTLDRFRAQLPDKAADYLNEVRKAGERARDLIQKMLAFARGGGGESVLLDPRPLVREVIKMLRGAMPSSLDIRENIADSVPGIHIDPVHLHQMLTNLVINARDATEGEGRIEIGLALRHCDGEICAITQQPMHGDFVELSVRDNGSGIAPEVLPKIFDPFFTTKEVGKGSGMGLAMVMGILREHNSHVLVESSPGQGAVFRLLFPPAGGHASATPRVDAPPPAGAREGQRILVVDDEAALGQLLGEVLDAHGYQSSIHANPLAALAAYRADPGAFDAVITDQTMPGMTGLELARELLTLTPDLPVFMVSGYSDKVDAESAHRMGIRQFFHKPVESGELLQALREL